jgi:hypothetical protein
VEEVTITVPAMYAHQFDEISVSRILNKVRELLLKAHFSDESDEEAAINAFDELAYITQPLDALAMAARQARS